MSTFFYFPLESRQFRDAWKQASIDGNKSSWQAGRQAGKATFLSGGLTILNRGKGQIAERNGNDQFRVTMLAPYTRCYKTCLIFDSNK